jgi:K+-sensing histidine kinase KdpD
MPSARRIWPVVISAAIIFIATLAIEAVAITLEPQHLIFAYLIPTTFIAVRYGSVVAVLTSVACSICGAFFLFPPRFSVYIAQPLHVAELGFFLLLAVATAQYINVLSSGEQPRRPT